MKKIISIIILTTVFVACEDDFLDRFPKTEISEENFFNTEEDLMIYTYGLYNFPGHGSIYTGDITTDNQATTGVTELKTMMTGSPTASTITGGWNWGDLRDINFFLENYTKADLPQDILDHYVGIARFFRANFYLDKVKRYSDVPWYDFVLNTNDQDALQAPRDPRDLVISRIFEDYSFASEHVKTGQAEGAVDKWTALAYQARHALYEGTFRKYHPELALESSANQFLEMARDLAMQIMVEGGFSIYSTDDPNNDYGTLFNNTDLGGNPEIIFSVFFEDEILNSGLWPYMFGNYESSPTRDLMQSYLNSDGSYYSSVPGFETQQFVEEFQNRDPRLSQTYAYPGWVLSNTSTYSQGGGVYVQQLQKNFSGYHQLKGFINDPDPVVTNGVDLPTLRYAEILLIYAEAKAELGELTQQDLDMTINVIRDRVGMPHLTMGTLVDPWQQAIHPNVSSAELLEIRRERRVELALEGFRSDDLMRWGNGKAIEKRPLGLYFPGLGKYDLNGDAVEDIFLIPNSESIPEGKELNGNGVPLIYYRVGPPGSDASFYLTEGNRGYVVATDNRGLFEEPKYYYRPVPETQVTLNPNLTQIFGW
jgi:hypothetical protein